MGTWIWWQDPDVCLIHTTWRSVCEFFFVASRVWCQYGINTFLYQLFRQCNDAASQTIAINTWDMYVISALTQFQTISSFVTKHSCYIEWISKNTNICCIYHSSMLDFEITPFGPSNWQLFCGWAAYRPWSLWQIYWKQLNWN